MKFCTIKSISTEGTYYLVNHWCENKTFWIEPEKIKQNMLFRRPSDAKRSLTKLLKTMDEYRNDIFEVIFIQI